MERLLTRQQIADLADVDPRTIDRWRKGKNVPVALRTRQNGGRVAFAASDLEAFRLECERARDAAKAAPPRRRLKLSRAERRYLDKLEAG